MLTNKDIFKTLIEVGYTVEDISGWTQIDVTTLKKLKKNGQLSEQEQEMLNKFFRMNISEVDAKSLEDEEFRNSHLVLTPNGFKKCEGYIDTGSQYCFKISFNSFSTIIPNKRKLQLANDEWVSINKLKVGDKLKVFDSDDEIISIEKIDNIECCDINIKGSCYIDGVVIK